MTCNSGYPILPVGKVNLLTGKNAEWGTIWNLWEDGTYLLVKQDPEIFGGAVKFRAIITSSPMAEAEKYNPVGDKLSLIHDQTGARFGYNSWTVVGLFENSPAGLRKMAEVCGKKSLPFATFK